MSKVLAIVAAFLLLGAATLACADQQRPHVLVAHGERTTRLEYLLFVPSRYGSSSAKWPLILYLHGGSRRGSDIEKVRALGLPKRVEREPEFPFLVVSPQCPEGEIWTDAEALSALLDDVAKKYRVDLDRIYVTGHSMGGRGALYLAYRHPERFAAVLALSPISPIDAWAARLPKLPIWLLHGADDPIAPVSDTEALTKAIEVAGGHPRLTILPKRDHDILDIYDGTDAIDWLNLQRRHRE